MIDEEMASLENTPEPLSISLSYKHTNLFSVEWLNRYKIIEEYFPDVATHLATSYLELAPVMLGGDRCG